MVAIPGKMPQQYKPELTGNPATWDHHTKCALIGRESCERITRKVPLFEDAIVDMDNGKSLAQILDELSNPVKKVSVWQKVRNIIKAKQI